MLPTISPGHTIACSNLALISAHNQSKAYGLNLSWRITFLEQSLCLSCMLKSNLPLFYASINKLLGLTVVSLRICKPPIRHFSLLMTVAGVRVVWDWGLIPNYAFAFKMIRAMLTGRCTWSSRVNLNVSSRKVYRSLKICLYSYSIACNWEGWSRF